MKFVFKKAETSQGRARVTLIGPSGSGKTYSALRLASGMGQKIAVIDTENGSASKYADEFDFHVLSLDDFSPQTYVKALEAAQDAGFDVVIVDSLSHAWIGKNGALELVNKAEKRYHGNSFAAWRDVTPLHNAMVDAILRCDCHLIATMRSKTEYVIESDDKGRKVPRKIGLAPVQRDGIEYEFDIVADIDLEHNMLIQKTRCRALDGAVFHKPGPEVAQIIMSWLHGEQHLEVNEAVTTSTATAQVDAADVSAATEAKPSARARAKAKAQPPVKPSAQSPVDESPATGKTHDEAPAALEAETQPQPAETAAADTAPQPPQKAEAKPARKKRTRKSPAKKASAKKEKAKEAAEATPEPQAKVEEPQEITHDDAWKTAAMTLVKTARSHFNGDHDLVLNALKFKEGVNTSQELSTARLAALNNELEQLVTEGEASVQAQLIIWRQMLSTPEDHSAAALAI